MSTSGGGIRVVLDAGANLELDASTSGGTVRSELPITIQGTIDQRSLKGTLGGGWRDAEAPGLGRRNPNPETLTREGLDSIVRASSQPDQVESDTDKGRASDVVGPSAKLLTGQSRDDRGRRGPEEQGRDAESQAVREQQQSTPHGIRRRCHIGQDSAEDRGRARYDGKAEQGAGHRRADGSFRCRAFPGPGG